MTLLSFMMVTALMVGGMGVALLGSIKVALARRLQIDEARVGGLVSLFGFTLMPVIFAAGFLTDLVGRQAVLLAGSVVFAGSLGLLACARSYGPALGGVILLSAGWSLLINVGNVLVPLAFPGESKAFSTNLGNVFFGLGAFLTPVGVALLTGRFSLFKTLAVLAGFSLLPGILTLALDPTVLNRSLDSGTPATGADQTLGSLLADPMMWLLGFALFFYGPLEASLAAWTTTFLGDKGVGEKNAATLLSAFWLTFMAARLITAFTLPPGWETYFIGALALASAAVLSAGVVSRNKEMAVATVLGAGLVFGPIFPTVMAVLLGHFPERLHGRAVGIFFAIGGIGWTLIPMLIGAYAKKVGVQRAWIIAVAAALGLTGVALGLMIFGE